MEDFASGPMAKILSSGCRGPGFNPGWGTRSHELQLKKILHASTKIKDPLHSYSLGVRWRAHLPLCSSSALEWGWQEEE